MSNLRFLQRFLDRLPAHKENAKQVAETTERVTFALGRYHTLEKTLKKEIEENHIANRLLYDRGK